MNQIDTVQSDGNKIVPLFRSESAREAAGSDDTASERYRWLYAVHRDLVTLIKLKQNWDSYGARPVAQDTLLFATQVLSDIWIRNLSRPFISPMSSEGIMIEWTANNCEFIISIEGPYRIQYFFDCPADGEPEEGELTQLDFSELKAFARDFTNRTTDQRQIA